MHNTKSLLTSSSSGMNAKVVLILIGIINYSHSASLLRTPKVYNAVITTDENLTPSRAFPVIQPTIHETGIATYPLGAYNPYRFYNPPIVHFPPPGFYPREHIPVPQPPPQDIEPEQRMLPPEFEQMQPPPQQNYPSQSPPSNNDNNKNDDNNSSNRNNNNINNNNDQMQPNDEEKNAPPSPPPIPLNEYGLPPSLVPLQSHPHSPSFQSPISLQPYTYNHYPPIIYEPPSLKQFPNPYLPHYGYYPPHTYSIRAQPPKRSKNPTSNSIPQQQKPQEPQQQNPNEQQQKISNNNISSPSREVENIKNGTVNKNSEVPDVPPPPIPSGAKASSK